MIKKLMDISGAQILGKEEQMRLLGGTEYNCYCFGPEWRSWTISCANAESARISLENKCGLANGICYGVEDMEQRF